MPDEEKDHSSSSGEEREQMEFPILVKQLQKSIQEFDGKAFPKLNSKSPSVRKKTTLSPFFFFLLFRFSW